MNGFEEEEMPGDVVAADAAGTDEYARDAESRRLAEGRIAEARGAVDAGFGSVRDYRRSVAQRRIQEAQNAMMDQAYQEQKASWDDYSGLVGKDRQRSAQRQIGMQNDVDCLMSLAASNGGVVPQVAIDLFNRKFGFDPASGTGLFSARYDDSGNFGVQMGTGRIGPGGRPILQEQVAGPMDQWIMMNRNKAAFTDEIRGMYRDFLSKRYSDAELDKAAGITRPVGAKTESGGTVVPGSWLTGGNGRSGIHAFSSDGRGGFSWNDNGARTDGGTRADPNDARNWRVAERGAADRNGTQYTRYVNQMTGQEETVLDGEIPPWQRGGNGPNGMSEKMALEQMRQNGLNQRADEANKTKKQIAEQNAEVQIEGNKTKKEIAGMQVSGRKAVADVQAAVKQQGYLSNEHIAQIHEDGRNERAEERNKIGRAKIAADITKENHRYEVALKNAKNDEERNRITEEHNKRFDGIAEGRLQYDKDRLVETSRHNQATEEIQQQRADTDQYKAETAEELGQQRIEENKAYHKTLADAQEAARKQREEMGEKNYQLKLKEYEAKVSGKIQNGKSGRSNAELVLGLVPRLMQANRMVPDDIHGSRPEPIYKSEDEAIDAAIGMVNKVRNQSSDGESATQPAAQQQAAEKTTSYPVPKGKPSMFRSGGVLWRIVYGPNGEMVGKQRIQ